MATYFELTSLAHVKCSPHKPYIITSYECAPLAMIYSISMLDRWSHLHSFQLWLQSKTSTFAHLTSFTMLRSWPSTESLHHCPCTSLNKLMSVSKGGALWRKFYTSKRCQFEVCSHHPLYYCITITRSSLSCFLTFYGIPTFHTFLIRRIFYLLVSFPLFYCIHMHGVQ